MLESSVQGGRIAIGGSVSVRRSQLGWVWTLLCHVRLICTTRRVSLTYHRVRVANAAQPALFYPSSLDSQSRCSSCGAHLKISKIREFSSTRFTAVL